MGEIITFAPHLLVRDVPYTHTWIGIQLEALRLFRPEAYEHSLRVSQIVKSLAVKARFKPD